MAGLLDGHLAVVTGSGSGIGRAIALGYAKQGAQVVALDIDGDSAAETAKTISRAGGKAHSFTLDVRERDRCRDVAAQIELKIGQISILVNNAGINRRNAFTAEPEAVISPGGPGRCHPRRRGSPERGLRVAQALSGSLHLPALPRAV